MTDHREETAMSTPLRELLEEVRAPVRVYKDQRTDEWVWEVGDSDDGLFPFRWGTRSTHDEALRVGLGVYVEMEAGW